MPLAQISDLKPGSKIHLIGICGTAMASLAGLLKDRGFQVTGSDASPYPPMSTQLEQLKIPVKSGYRAENLHPHPDFVIVGNVISRGNPEADELLKLDLKYNSLPQSLGDLILRSHDTICVSGTHGKTTTTSLMSWVIACLEKEPPGFLIGGIPKNFSRSFQNPKGKYFIIEGDEYDTAFFDKVPKFIHYHPKHAILTSVEFDHADIYKDLQAVKNAFLMLVPLIPKDGNLVYCSDEANVREIAAKLQSGKGWSYGLTENGDLGPNYLAHELKTQTNQIEFQVSYRERNSDKRQKLGDFVSPMSGRYNVQNVLAVIALSHVLGFDLAKVRAAIAEFQGVKRRQEILGEPGGVLIIEDFAHHPTAVKETVLGIQERYKGKKFFAVFEPRSATSRRRVFQKDYVDAFKLCHEVLIAEAYDQSKIAETDRFSVAELVSDIAKQGVPAKSFGKVDEIVSFLSAKAKSGDGILIMSNGGFDGIYQKLIKSLSQKA